MATIAETVAQKVNGASAYTLHGGYASFLTQGPDGHWDSKVVRFPASHPVEHRFNDKGRTTYYKGSYPDGSFLELKMRGDRAVLTTGLPKSG